MDLFGKEKTVLIMEPAYPAYVDANVIAGNTIIHIPAGEENGFVPVPDPDIAADVIYICSRIIQPALYLTGRHYRHGWIMPTK